ncbi:MAG TPA: response regulator [Rhodanobacteraceae bacterium]
MADRDLAGLRVLIVEDESMVAMWIEDSLADAGCKVMGVASTLEEAMGIVESQALDAAVLDVNLNGVRTFPIAETLLERRVPFVFSTGYGATGVPEKFGAAPVLAKPFRRKDLEVALKAALECADTRA